MKAPIFLSYKTNKALKVVHVLLAGTILGCAIAILVLIQVKQELPLDSKPFPLDLAIYRLFNYGVNYPFFALLFTAVVYGTFTPRGFFQHIWIIFKWFFAAVIFAVTWFWLGMAVNGMVGLSESGETLAELGQQYFIYNGRALHMMLIEVAGVASVILVSVLKPRGRMKPFFNLRQRTVIIIIALLLVGLGTNTWLMVSMLHRYRLMAITETDLTVLKDGVYRGGAPCGGFTYETEAVVADQRLVDLVITKNRESPYAVFAESVIPKNLRQQTANVDAITGGDHDQ